MTFGVLRGSTRCGIILFSERPRQRAMSNPTNDTLTPIWKRHPSHPNYEVSTAGQVRRIGGRILKTPKNSRGYPGCEVKHGYVYCVHRLVLETFVGSRPNGLETRHLNGIKSDNRLVNLAWGTRKQNSADTFRHLGVDRLSHKLSEKQVRDIRENGDYYKIVAKKHNCCEGTIHDIRSGRSWAKLPPSPSGEPCSTTT